MLNWNFENTGASSGEANMKRDEELAQALCNGAGASTLRFYCWQPWMLSVGWHQSLEEIDCDAVHRDGYDLVRRPTGGRAIFHAEELTYCAVFFSNGESIYKTYENISLALLEGLRNLGIEATYEKQQPHFPSLYRTAQGVPCFSAAGRYEITYEGKKLIGSAQRRYIGENGAEVVLQHGSILIGRAHTSIVRYLRVQNDEREKIRLALETKTTELSTILHRSLSYEEVASAFRRGFENALNINFVSNNTIKV
jgi:lipoate-protein ligase A